MIQGGNGCMNAGMRGKGGGKKKKKKKRGGGRKSINCRYVGPGESVKKWRMKRREVTEETKGVKGTDRKKSLGKRRKRGTGAGSPRERNCGGREEWAGGDSKTFR